jgi:hypothetical protein
MRTYFVAVTFLLVAIVSVEAQVPLSMDEFLTSSYKTQSLLTVTNQQNFLGTKPYQLSPLRKIAFQTVSNQLDRTRQGYSLRFLPSNPWEVRNTNSYFKTYEELLRIDYDRKLRESLRTHYLAIIDWIFSDEVYLLRQEEKLNTTRLLTIYESQRSTDLFDPEEYVELKINQVDQTIELEEATFNRESVRKKIESLYETAKLSTIEWSSSTIVGVDMIETMLNRSKQEKTINGSEVSYREKQIELAMRKWRLEKSNVNIGFIQSEYEPFREENNRRPWSISLGVTIPLVNPNKGDMAQRKLQVIEAEGTLVETKRDQAVAKEIVYEKMQSLLTRYQDINQMMKSITSNELQATIQQLENNNPVTTLRLKSKTIKLKMLVKRLERDLLTNYIEFLALAELLQSQPLVNYLSPSLSQLGTLDSIDAR